MPTREPSSLPSPPTSPPGTGEPPGQSGECLRTGWGSWLARLSLAALLFEAITGLAVTVGPFHPAVQWSVILHTVLGVVILLPVAWYCARHIADYRTYAWSHITLVGWVALVALAAACASGVVLTVQAVFGVQTGAPWRMTHLAATLLLLAGLLPHLLFVVLKQRHANPAPGIGAYFAQSLGFVALGCALCVGLVAAYSGMNYHNKFPADYSFLYGTNRPFAPSLARTDTGGAFDARSLAGSRSCGTAGCHEQIVEEWLPSAHRYAAMDTVFLGIQDVMAKQNGSE